jgi:CheY-like chemotaxis protein
MSAMSSNNAFTGIEFSRIFIRLSTLRIRGVVMDQDAVSASSRPAKILVVDDERHIARFLVYVLTEQGYNAQAVYDGEEALAAVPVFAPDGILLDLLLPKLSGQEVLTRLRADTRYQKIKIVMLTGCPMQGDAPEPLESGADVYCLKPIGPSVLIKLLKENGLPSRIQSDNVS